MRLTVRPDEICCIRNSNHCTRSIDRQMHLIKYLLDEAHAGEISLFIISCKKKIQTLKINVQINTILTVKKNKENIN